MRIGIDLGGTKIEGIALARNGSELARLRLATPRTYPETVAAVAGLVLAALMEWRGNLLAPIVTHAVVNGVGLWRLSRPRSRQK